MLSDDAEAGTRWHEGGFNSVFYGEAQKVPVRCPMSSGELLVLTYRTTQVK